MEVNMERTLVIIKPDGIMRGLCGEILKRYEKKGMTIIAIKSLFAKRHQAEEHYIEHKDNFFYNEIVDYLLSGMIISIVLEGENAIKCVRIINGATKYQDALPGTIRGDYAYKETYNLVHSSDSIEAAQREIAIWFPELAVSYLVD
jgi:nucleoside-diphosphate kinase